MTQNDELKPFSTAPKDGTMFYVEEYYRVPFKWKPYNPKSQQYKRGIKGRWQEMNKYGGWENSNKRPTHWQSHPDDTRAETLKEPVDVEGLKKKVDLYGFNRGQFRDIKNSGWNDCIDYLAQQGYLSNPTLPQEQNNPASLSKDAQTASLNKQADQEDALVSGCLLQQEDVRKAQEWMKEWAHELIQMSMHDGNEEVIKTIAACLQACLREGE